MGLESYKDGHLFSTPFHTWTSGRMGCCQHLHQMAIQSLGVEAKELWMDPRGSRMATENLDCGGDGRLENGHQGSL